MHTDTEPGTHVDTQACPEVPPQRPLLRPWPQLPGPRATLTPGPSSFSARAALLAPTCPGAQRGLSPREGGTEVRNETFILSLGAWRRGRPGRPPASALQPLGAAHAVAELLLGVVAQHQLPQAVVVQGLLRCAGETLVSGSGPSASSPPGPVWPCPARGHTRKDAGAGLVPLQHCRVGRESPQGWGGRAGRDDFQGDPDNHCFPSQIGTSGLFG